MCELSKEGQKFPTNVYGLFKKKNLIQPIMPTFWNLNDQNESTILQLGLLYESLNIKLLVEKVELRCIPKRTLQS